MEDAHGGCAEGQGRDAGLLVCYGGGDDEGIRLRCSDTTGNYWKVERDRPITGSPTLKRVTCGPMAMTLLATSPLTKERTPMSRNMTGR